jgi:hypothetical protein
MFTMNLCQKYPEGQLNDLRDYLSGISRFLIDRACSARQQNICSPAFLKPGPRGHWMNSCMFVAGAYGEIMIATADEKRMKRLEQVMANDSHLPELAAKHAAAAGGPSRG